MTRPCIALSIGSAPEQLERGFGEEHLAEALVLIARLLLRRGCDLAYGGDLRPEGYTALLARLVRAETAPADLGAAEVRRSRDLRRLVDYLAWPASETMTVDLQARWLGQCRFVCIDAPPHKGGGKGPDEADAAYARLRQPLALRMMRRAMARGGARDIDGKPVPATAARIVLGGKVAGFHGLMPGIVEEVGEELMAGPDRPLFLLGGFGGAAELLARSVRAGALVPELSEAAHAATTPELAGLRAALDQPELRAIKNALELEAGAAALVGFCAEGPDGLARRNKLSPEQNLTLLTSTDLDTVREVLACVPWQELQPKRPRLPRRR